MSWVQIPTCPFMTGDIDPDEYVEQFDENIDIMILHALKEEVDPATVSDVLFEKCVEISEEYNI